MKSEILFKTPMYQKLVDEVLNGYFDIQYMEIAIERAAGNIDKAQALYILFMMNGHWPKNK